MVSGDADALVSRILTYPDLSLLADTIGSDGSEGGGSGGAAGEGITMYAVAPTPPASATPAAPTTLLSQPQTIQPPPHQQQFQVLTTAAPTSGCGTTDYLCNDCNIVFSDVNAFLQHISHGHQEQNVVQVCQMSFLYFILLQDLIICALHALHMISMGYI